MGRTFDPITLEILWRRLIAIVDEADGSVARTAFSSLLRDAHDYTCMFTDKRGWELAQGTFATPGQSGAMALGVKHLINKFPFDFYQPGDVFITNDPWALAGHLNDICVMSPIFYQNQLVALPPVFFITPISAAAWPPITMTSSRKAFSSLSSSSMTEGSSINRSWI